MIFMAKNRKLTKATQVFLNLQADIIHGRLEEGSRLQMEFLKDRYQVGYSPLREALSRLVSHGLVEMEEQCGFRVPTMSLKDFYDLHLLRRHIDTLALELAIERGCDKWEAEVIAKWHQLSKYTLSKTNDEIDLSAWQQIQKDFLTTLIKGCDAPWLSKISMMLFDQAIRYRTLCLNENFYKKEWRTKYIKDREHLMKAILARDTQKAIKLAHKGWDQTIKSTGAILKKKEQQKIRE